MGVYGTTGRLEKSYRAYGTELDNDYDTVEADMVGAKIKDQDFVGRAAVLAAMGKEPAARLLHAHRGRPHRRPAASGGTCWAASRSSSRTARRSSTPRAAGRTRPRPAPARRPGKHVLLAYLPPEQAVEGNKLFVQYFAELYPVTVAVVGARPLFDPENLRIRA